MNTRKLGRTGLEVSEIAFGGVEIGLVYGIGVNCEADMPGEEESIDLLYQALETGITFFDTARQYGRSETVMGKAFRDRRDRVVLCSKCAHLPREQGRLPGATDLRNWILASLETSLKELQTDHLDVFMLHNADEDILNTAVIADTFADCKARGLIRATGVSTYQVQETRIAIEKGGWDVIQLPFNLMDQRQAALFDQAEAAGVGLVIRSVLLKGVLSDKGRNLHPCLQAVEDHRNRYTEFFTPERPKLSTLATQFALSYPQVSSVLVGIDRIDYLHQAVSSANGRYLNAQARKQAEALAFPDPEFLDLPLWDQMGWLK